MKKISALVIAVVISAMATVSASAAGINDAEQAVLDELGTSVTMQGTEMVYSDDYVNQVKNYFNTVEVTDSESKEMISAIQEGKDYMKNSGAKNVMDMTYAQKEAVLGYGKKAVGTIGMTMSFDKTTKELTIKSPNGDVVFCGSPNLVAKGGSSSTDNNSSNSNSNTNNNTTVGDNNVIKTTGANVNTAAMAGVAGVSVAVAAMGATYSLKNKKEA
ncbi:MAG: hypothetical protein UD936_08620 [Acutalibacteraceae bacterium]|nr:hypothetical protein [Acutalibacteraceae bacterium]